MHKVVASECCSRGTNFTERIGKSKDQQTSSLKQEIALLQRRTRYTGTLLDPPKDYGLGCQFSLDLHAIERADSEIIFEVLVEFWKVLSFPHRSVS